jgi:hypothetical protein
MKFFRNIRKRFLYKKKFSKYLGYAFGEITLVVIGILIALAINNRNQDRINEKNEQIYLTGLSEEFQTSKLKLAELIAVNQANYIGAKEILEHVTANELPSEIVFSTQLYNTFSSDIAFNPNNSLLFEMINSGNLKNLSNTELRKQLTNWSATMEDVSRQEEELAIQREKILDMFRTNRNSLRTIFQQAGVYDDLKLLKSENEVSNLALLKSIKFENNVLMFILTSYATEKAHYYPLMQDIDGILELINNERN